MADTETTNKPKSKRKPKQKELPTMEREAIPKLEKLADTYCDRRNDRMAKLEEEVASRTLLEAAMKEAGLKHYEYDGKTIDLVSEQKVKVKTKKPEDDEDGDEAEE
jgi:hypothetical protein